MLVPAAVLLLAGAAAAGQPPHHLRTLRDLPFPTTLDAAKSLHAEAMRRARALELHHGHTHRAATPHAVAPASRLLTTHAANAPIIPADFGADPTGEKDSTVAMNAAMAALLSARGPRHTMASNITDLGGELASQQARAFLLPLIPSPLHCIPPCVHAAHPALPPPRPTGATLDLSGGTYLISAPLVIPPLFGNAAIVGGTLRASPTFPADRWLVEIGNVSCIPKLADGSVDVQGSCGQFFNLNDMMFDAGHVAAGGVRVGKVMGTTIGPSVFFTGFTKAGVRIDAGHEVMIMEGWFCECEWSDARGSVCQEDPDKPHGNRSTSIGVQINGNDHFMTDVIVFEYTHVGVEINGAANILQG